MISHRTTLALFVLQLVTTGCGDDTTGTGGGSSSDATASSGTSEATTSTAATTTAATSVASTAAGTGTGGAGGAGDGGAGGEASWEPTDEQIAACEVSAEAICGAYSRCVASSFTTLYGDLETCIDSLVPYCVGLFAPGSNLQPADVEACAAANEELSCADLYRRNLFGQVEPEGDCAAPPGELETGEPCINGVQCSTLLCSIGQADDCGVCAGRPQVGDACLHGVCDFGLACLTATNRCVELADAGDACGASLPCFGDLYCDGGTCSELIEPGGDCDGSQTSVNQCAQEGFCNINDDVCELFEIAAPGGTCGLMPAGNLAGCGFGEACQITNPQAFSGECVPSLELGDTCSGTWFGYPCGFGAACVAGICDENPEAAEAIAACF